MQYLVSVIDDTAFLATPEEMANDATTRPKPNSRRGPTDPRWRTVARRIGRLARRPLAALVVLLGTVVGPRSGFCWRTG
jgi:hypothetical protein